MNILVSGLSTGHTGLGNVLESLRTSLATDHCVKTLGFGDAPAPLDDPRHDLGVVTGRMAAGRFTVDQGVLDECLARVHVVIVLGSPFSNERLLHQVNLSTFRERVYVLYYASIEGRPVSPWLLDILGLADACAFYTQAALTAVQDIVANVGTSDGGQFLTSLHAVGHGVDRERFANLGLRQDRDLCLRNRRRFWAAQRRSELAILNVARPYRRKRLDLAISAFARFRRRHQDARLVLATGALSDIDRATLNAAAEAEGVGDHVEMLEATGRSQKDQELLYNVCDIGLSTAGGEGWGLPLFEHAATGAPIVAPDHTTFAELWSERAILAGIDHTYPDSFEFSEMFAVDLDQTCQALLRLTDAPERSAVGARCEEAVRGGKLDWSDVGASLIEIVHARAEGFTPGDSR